jgi:hypothetical protein
MAFFLANASNALPYIKPMQGMLALAGAAFLTNPLHGGVGKAMAKIGYPSWFFPCVGIWQITCVALNYYNVR